MAAFGFTTDYTNILTAGVSSWKLMSGKSGEVGYVDITPITEGKAVAKILSVPDTVKRPNPFGIGYEFTARVLGTAKTSCLQKLALLTGYMNYHHITLLSGKAFGTQMGTHWKFVCDGNMDAYRYIELGADLASLIEHASLPDWDAIGVAYAGEAAGQADLLYGFSPGAIIPAGFTSVDTRNAGETAWETLGSFRAPKLTAELQVVKDPHMRSVGYAVKADVEFDMMQTDEEFALLDAFADGQPDLKVTLVDGTVFTFADNLGLSWEYHNDKDSDDIAYTRVMASRTMTPAQFVACIS